MSEVTNTINATLAAPFIPEVWSARVIDEYVAGAVASDLVDRRFDPDLSKSGDTLHLGTISKVVPISRTVNTDMTYNAEQETWDNVSIDQDYYIFRKLEPLTKAQSLVDMLNQYAKIDGKAMAEKVDTTVTALFDLLNSNTTVGTAAVDVTDDNLLRCVQYLDDSLVPSEDRAWLISPGTFTSLMKIDKFVRLDYVMPKGQTAIESAKLNYPIYGAPVYVCNTLEGNAATDHDNALLQREAIILIIQSEPSVVKAYDVRGGYDTIKTECIWGVGEERDLNGVCLLGK